MPILRSVGLRYRGAVSGGGGSFSPDDIAGLQLWLDASDLSTITESGGAVSQWDDKSGQGNHVTQGTAASQPTTGTRTINGKNALDFDGSDDSMVSSAFSTTITQPYDVFFVALRDTNIEHYFLDGIDSSNRGAVGADTASRYTMFAGGAVALFTTSADTGNAHVIQARFDGSSSAAWIDGAQTSGLSPGTDARTGIRVGSIYDASAGGGRHTDGLIAEVLIYDSALASADREAVETYLADRWGITL